MEWQNLIFRKKIYIYKVYNIIKLFKNTQRAQCGEDILMNIYISGYFGDMGYV